MQAGEYGAWSFVWLHSAAFHRKGGAPNHNEIFSKEARILYQGAIMWGSETRRNGKVLLLSGAPISTLLASDQCDGRRKGKIDAIVHVDSVVVGKPLKKLARGINMAEAAEKRRHEYGQLLGKYTRCVYEGVHSMRRTTASEVKFWRSAKRQWSHMLIEGVGLVMFGLLAFVLPVIAARPIDRVIGWLFVFAGVIGLINTAGNRDAPGFWWSLLSAALSITVGSILIEWPREPSNSLIYLFTFFFVVEGIATILYAVDHKRRLSGRWKWMVASGAVDLALAALVAVGLPATAPWAIGVLVGINMVFGGSAMIAMALYAHTARF